MELDHALRLITESDNDDRAARAARLVDLSDLLGDRSRALHGQAAEWLFDDVKATWLSGYFTATVLTAYAFCAQQLAGLVRMVSNDSELTDDASTLEMLAELAGRHGIVDLDERARLVRLHDSAAMYLSADPSTYRRQLERRVEDDESFTDEHTLLVDARSALECCVGLLHR